MLNLDHFVSIDFERFKAFKRFTLDLRHFNILVGPNNAGKSTILAAFRMLAHAMRRAESRKAELLHGPNGLVHGHNIDLSQISVAEENLFFDYNDDEAASVRFRLASGNSLLLYFPEHGTCRLIPDARGHACSSPASFKTQFRCPIGFVPILGPVDQIEELNERETARRALFNYRAARNFRNTWYHFPEGFETLREMIGRSWPGMDMTPPELNRTHDKPRLELWCPEQRKPREIAWAGFGFQVWCQMLTHVVRWRNSAVFLIDEPDIYLHSDLQRQLLGILRTLGPDIVLATHSTEIVTEAETDDIVLIDKRRTRSRRLKRPDQLSDVFALLGSTINPVLTQIAKTRRVLFVEGEDFQLLGRFARRLGFDRVANRADFAVVRVEGFNPERIRNLKAGMEETLGVKVAAAAILDSDYRSRSECKQTEQDLAAHCQMVVVHDRKEIENFLLVPEAIDRAAVTKLQARARREGIVAEPRDIAHASLEQFAAACRTYVFSQRLAAAKRFDRDGKKGTHEEIINERELEQLEAAWGNPERRLRMIGGKDALSRVSKDIQEQLGISITSAGVIDAMRLEEIPPDMVVLVRALDAFARGDVPGAAEG
jgi:energy-coupling factor transporter ATP-binding protein EcfA2